MTLIISKLTPYGIVMVADSAETKSYELSRGKATRVRNGTKKVQTIPHLSAGISMWGLGEIPKTDLPMDIWLSDFIKQREYINSLQEFADALRDALQAQIGNVQIPMGLHLAGYV